MAPMNTPLAVMAFTVMGAAVGLAAWARFRINERRFLRRTIAGSERFPSYANAVFTRFWEGIAIRLASVVMVIAVFSGLWLTVVLYGSH
jgi:hypothetical protein